MSYGCVLCKQIDKKERMEGNESSHLSAKGSRMKLQETKFITNMQWTVFINKNTHKKIWKSVENKYITDTHTIIYICICAPHNCKWGQARMRTHIHTELQNSLPTAMYFLFIVKCIKWTIKKEHICISWQHGEMHCYSFYLHC
jgi:hypothetical protein